VGISKSDCSFLFHSKTCGVNFRKTLTLGRLRLYASEKEIQSCVEKYNHTGSVINKEIFKDEYSEPLFSILGAETIDSIDYSDYQKATIIQDLNLPIGPAYYNQFTCIVDGGTMEHIFNFPSAIKSCMMALQTGGHYIGISPCNNQMGHGFYQFSPELYYRIFSEENGFVIKQMLVTPLNTPQAEWYEAVDPKTINSRAELVNDTPLSLMFIAEKTAEKNIFSSMPQQSDYSRTWIIFKSIRENKSVPSNRSIAFLYRKFIPLSLRIILSRFYAVFSNKKIITQSLGKINPKHFRKVEI
jgi:hypothetical protein